MSRLSRLLPILCLAFFCGVATAQNVNIEDFANLKDKQTFKLNGGVSATTGVYRSNDMAGRQSFTYQLNGNLNLSILELVDIPVSINLNNYGSHLSYPSMPNRFSLHPSYKWIKAHIGDVSMSFSPYTLNGHMFTGGGVELTPGNWTIMAMGGRMLRKVDYDPDSPSIMPSFDRYGYGAKTRYDGGKFFAGGSLFMAADNENQTNFRTDSLGIFPQSNIAMSIEGGVDITPNLKVSVEYGASILTRDSRMASYDKNTFDKLVNRKESTNYYDAVKASLEYTFLQNTIGLGYERISPQYQTLGAYYSNNDYENFTLNYARPFLKGKGSIALSGGLQYDDLDGSKESKNTRIVGSVNVSYSPIDDLSLSLSGSTFQGHRVIKSQFDYINQTTPYENLDTLNFTQISQNVDFNLNWTVSRNEAMGHNITLFTSYQEAGDRQGGYILPGNLTRFLNVSTLYTLDLTAFNTSLNFGMNVSNNYSNMQDFLTYGPMIGAKVRLFQQKLTTGASFSANRSLQESKFVAEVFNYRWDLSYRFLKSHTIQTDLVYQQKNRIVQYSMNKTHSLNAQLKYFYSF